MPTFRMPVMHRSFAVAVLLLLVCPLIAAQVPQQAPQPQPPAVPADGPSTIKALVETSRMDELRWPDFSDYRKHLVNFYGRSTGNSPGRVAAGSPRRRSQ